MSALNETGRSQHPVMPHKVVRRGSRHQQVRAAALALFAAHGYRMTTIDEIGERAGIKGPSVYKHFRSKQDLLVEIMMGSIDALLSDQREAIQSTTDIREQLRRAVEAHVGYHAEHRCEAFVGNREIRSLDEPYLAEVLSKRHQYDLALRGLIENGVQAGVFDVESPCIASYSILDMGVGVSAWFRPSGEVSEDNLAKQYAELALRMVGAADEAPARLAQEPRDPDASTSAGGSPRSTAPQD